MDRFSPGFLSVFQPVVAFDDADRNQTLNILRLAAFVVFTLGLLLALTWPETIAAGASIKALFSPIDWVDPVWPFVWACLASLGFVVMTALVAALEMLGPMVLGFYKNLPARQWIAFRIKQASFLLIWFLGALLVINLIVPFVSVTASTIAGRWLFWLFLAWWFITGAYVINKRFGGLGAIISMSIPSTLALALLAGQV